MSKCLAYPSPTVPGGVDVFLPAANMPADYTQQAGESEETWLARLALRVVPSGITYRIVDVRNFPLLPDGQWDKSFREAWMDTGAAVAVDMPKARGAHKAKLLALREEKLARLREKIDKADDNDDAPEVARLKQKRRRLNRLEATLDADLAAAATPAALAALLPADLA